MTNNPADVAALLDLAATEAAALNDLDGCVQRLRTAQDAKRQLAQVPPESLRAGLLERRARGGAQR